MFSLLVSAASSAWQTHHIGQPELFAVHDNDFLVYSKDSKLGLINATTQKLTWRDTIKDVVAIDVAEDVLVVTKHFWYQVDRETGIIVFQHLHDVKKPKIACIGSDYVYIASNTQLAAYQNSTKKWSIDIEAAPTVLKFIDGKLICNDSELSPETGEVLGKTDFVPPKYEISFSNTVIEFYLNGELKVRYEEPFYGSKIREVLPHHKILLSNKTHIIIFDFHEEEIVLTFEAKYESVTSAGLNYVIGTSAGPLLYNTTSSTLVPYTGKVVQRTTGKRSLKAAGKTLFAFNEDCEIKCRASNGLGYAFAAAQCKHGVATVMINPKDKVSSPTYTDNARLGTCWANELYAAISYTRTHRNTPMVTSFSFANATVKTFTTQKLIQKAGGDRFFFADGQMHIIPKQTLSPVAVQPAGGLMSTLLGQGVQVVGSDVITNRELGSYYRIKRVAQNQEATFLQGDDIFQLGGELENRSYELPAISAAVALVLAFFAVRMSQNSVKAAFWK